MAVVSVAQGDDEASNKPLSRDADTNTSNATIGLPPRPKMSRKVNKSGNGPRDKDGNVVSMKELKVPGGGDKDSSQRDENSQR